VDLKLSADGIRLDTQSLLSILIGGVAFDTPPTLGEAGAPAAEDQYFPLYANRDEAHEKVYLDKKRFLLFFEGSVRGLSVGAPVMLRGIKLGQVLDIQLEFDVESFRFHIPVLIEVEPDRIRFVHGDYEDVETKGKAPIERFVREGLRAQLKSGNLITGQLFVDLDFYKRTPKAEIRTLDGYPIIPTQTTAPLEELTNKANEFLNTLNELPLGEIGDDLRDTVRGAKEIATSVELKRSVSELEQALKQVRGTAKDLNADVVPKLSATLEQARATLRSADNLIGKDSVIYLETKRTLRELSAAARSVRGMADYLERHPEALIKGKGK